MWYILTLLSGLLYFFSIFWDSLIGFWLCVEAAGLVLLCGFFNYHSSYNRYLGLLYYLLSSGISSVLLFTGLLGEEYNGLVVISACIKAGLFPFTSWVLAVYNNCNWVLLYFLAVVSKVSLLYYANFFSGDYALIVQVAGVLSLLVCGVGFWAFSFGIKSLVSLSSVGSGSVLLLLLVLNGMWAGFSIYCIYAVVSFFTFYAFQKMESEVVVPTESVLGLFISLALPFSLSFLYKVVVTYFMGGVGSIVIVLWVFYSISEQFYLVSLILEKVNKVWVV